MSRRTTRGVGCLADRNQIVLQARIRLSHRSDCLVDQIVSQAKSSRRPSPPAGQVLSQAKPSRRPSSLRSSLLATSYVMVYCCSFSHEAHVEICRVVPLLLLAVIVGHLHQPCQRLRGWPCLGRYKIETSHRDEFQDVTQAAHIHSNPQKLNSHTM